MNFEKFNDLIALNQNEAIKKYIKHFFNHSDNWYMPLILTSNVDVLIYAIDLGFDFNQKNFTNTILLNGPIKVLEKMIEKGFVLDAEKLTKGLILSSYGQNKEIINFFLEKGVDINICDETKKKDTALNALLGNTNATTELFNYMIALGAKPTLEDNYTLCHAIENTDNLEIIQYLVENFAFNLNDELLLSKAFNSGVSPSIIQYLIDKNCPINHVAQNLKNYLDSSVYFFDYEKDNFNQVLDILKKKNRDIQVDLENVLSYVVKCFVKNSPSHLNKYLTVLDSLVKNGYVLDKNTVSYLSSIKNPFNLMSYAKNEVLNEVLAEKLEKNQDITPFVNIQFAMSHSNFFAIFQKSQKEVITQFLKSHKIHETNVLSAIVLNDNLNEKDTIKLVNQLIKLAPNIQSLHCEKKDGTIACYAKTVKLAEMFLNLGVKVLHVNQDGFNALYYDHMTPELIDFWVQKGLDVNLTYKQSKESALDYHLDDNHIEVIKTLIKHKAKISNQKLKEALSASTFKEVFEYKKALQEKFLLEKKLKNKNIQPIKNKI